MEAGMTGAEAIANAISDAPPPAPAPAPEPAPATVEESKAPAPATTDNQAALVDVVRDSRPRSFKELVEGNKPRIPARQEAEPAKSEESEETESEAETRNEVKGDQLIAVEHPQYGRILITAEQASRMLSGQTRQQQEAKPDLSQFDTERKKVEQAIAHAERDENLTPGEKDARLARLETRLLRLDQREAKALSDWRYNQFTIKETAERGMRETEQAMQKHADVFDATKAPTKALADLARRVLNAELNSQANDHLSEADVVASVARDLRSLAKAMNLAKRDTIKEYVKSKQVGVSAAPAPSKRGGQPTQRTTELPDIKSGAGRAMILRALEGRG